MKLEYKINKLSCFLLVISILICVWIVWNYKELFGLILEIKPGYIIILLILFIAVQLVNGYKLFMIVRFFGPNMKTFEWIGLPYITSYLNFLPVNAGSGATAVFLKKKYSLPYTKFISISGSLLLMELFCLSTAAFLLISLIRITGGQINGYSALAFLLIAIGVIGLRFVPIRVIKGRSRVTNWLKSTVVGFEELRRQQTLIVSLMVNSYLQLILLGLIIYFTFLSLGLVVNYLDGFLLGVVTSVSKYHFLLPGQLGLREMFIAFVTKMIQGSFNDGVIVAVTDRVISGVATIVLGNIFSWMIIRRIGD